MAVTFTKGNNCIVVPSADVFTDPTGVAALIDAGMIRPGAVKTDPGAVYPLKVKSLRWTGVTNAAHTCIIKDLTGASAAGATMYELHATSADYETPTEIDVCEWWTHGFQVPTMGSGTLYIYLA